MKFNRKNIIFIAVTFIALFNISFSEGAKTDNKPEKGLENGVFLPVSISQTGDKEPLDFSWTEDGKQMTFSKLLKGKITFINFWGTWCPPCRAEIPHLIELHKQYNSQGFNIVGFALERTAGDLVKSISDFRDKNNINYRLFPSREYADAFAKKFGAIQFVPTTFVVGRDGKILETIVGGRDKTAFEEIIKKYINKK